MEDFVTFLIILFGILQIVLLVKIWRMTDDVRKLKEHFCGKREYPKPTKTLSKQERNNAAKQASAHFR